MLILVALWAVFLASLPFVMVWVIRSIRKEKLQGLKDRINALEKQRDRIWAEMGSVEDSAAELGNQLKSAASQEFKRFLASRIAELRRQLTHLQRRANLHSQAIQVLQTYLDSLMVVGEVRRFRLPSAKEIKEKAVEVDELVAQVNEASDLARGVDRAAEAEAVDPEVEAILKEFTASAGAVEPKREKTEPEQTAVEKTKTSARSPPEREPA